MASDTPLSTPQQPVKKHWLSVLAVVFTALTLIMAIGIVVLFNSERGTHYAFSLLESLTHGTLQAQGINGSLSGPLQLDTLKIKLENQTISLSNTRVDWHPAALLRGKVKIVSLHIGKLAVNNKIDQTPKKSSGLPNSIRLPIHLQIDQVRIDNGSIAQGPVEILSLGTMIFGLDYDGKRYALNLDQLSANSTTDRSTFSTVLSGTFNLHTRKPYALTAGLESESTSESASNNKNDSEKDISEQAIGAQGTIKLNGSLAEIAATIDLHVAQALINGHATVRPFDEQVLAAAHLTGKNVNLAKIRADLPQTALDINLDSQENGKGILRVTNADAGLYNDNRLPLKTLTIDFSQSDAQFTFSKIAAELGTLKQASGRIDGKGSYSAKAIALRLQTDKLDLQKLDGRMRARKLAGTAELQTVDGKQVISLALAEPLSKNTLKLDAHAIIADNAIDINQLALRAGNSALDASAHIALNDAQNFSVKGNIHNFHLRDLGNFSQFKKLQLNGDFSMLGKRQPKLEADANFHINDSTLNNNALQGEGEIKWRANSIIINKLSLLAGANHVNAQGKLAGSDSQITFSIDAPQLSQIGAEFSGALQMTGKVTGDLQKPRIIAEWKGKAIHAPKQLQVNRTQGRIDLTLQPDALMVLDSADIDFSANGVQAGSQKIQKLNARAQFSQQDNAPLSIAIRANNISSNRATTDTLTLNVSGTTAQHVLHAASKDSEQEWTLSASGGLQKKGNLLRWAGNIDSIIGSGKFKAQLHAPAPLSVSRQKIQLDRFRLDTDNAYLAIEKLVSDQNGFMTDGKFKHLQINELLRYLQTEPAIGGDLKLSGEWDLKYGNTLNGTVAILRESGDAIMNGNASIPLGLQTLEARAGIDKGRVKLQLIATGQQLGRIEAHLDTSIGEGKAHSGLTLSPKSAIYSSILIDTPSLTWLGPLVSPALITEGKLQSNITIKGTVAQPHFFGKIAADELHLLFADTGLDLKQGRLRAEFRNDQLIIQTLAFHNDGTLSITGPLGLKDQTIALDLSIKADHYKLLDRSDRKLIISGESNVSWHDGSATAKGKFQANSGFFDISASDMPSLSDDVVVNGKEVKQATKTALSLDLDLDLGQGIKLSGRGLDALLTGSLKLYADAGQPLQAKGTLSVASGTFTAYGRKLDIEQGLVRFDGNLSNPALDIRAMRRGQEVEAGVSVRGTVMTPRITLVSEPTVPDAEKLSWLVLGRGLASADSNQAGQVHQAAGALLAQGAAAGLQAQIATAFGLDDFSVGADSDNLEQRIVRLGKNISARLYVGYKQGLDDTGSALLLRYKLSKRLSLEAEAGTNSALMVFYNFMFD